MPRIVGFGDNVVDCYEDHQQMFPGGNALNVAVFSRRSGVSSAYVGAVGDDAPGRHIRACLQAEEVDIAGLRTASGRTGFCVIGTKDGEREFLRADLGVSIIEPIEGDLEMIAAADAVHTGRSSHVEGYAEEFARRSNLSYDFAVVRDRARIAKIAPLCFLASFSGGGMTVEAAKELQSFVLQRGANWCLITRGEQGAMLAGPQGEFSVPAASGQVVDTLGAGDTFIARTLVGLLRSEYPEDILAASARMAAETCGHRGGFGYPAPLEIDESDAKSLREIYGSADEVRA